MRCPVISRGVVNVYALLIINSVLLCFCYLLYTLDWMRHTTTCGQTGVTVSYVVASSSIFYAAVALAATVFFCAHIANGYRNVRWFCTMAIVVVVYRLSSASLIYAVLSAGMMFISLYMKFNPACFKNRAGVTDVAYMSVVCAYNLVSYFVFLLISILLFDSMSPIEDVEKAPFGGVSKLQKPVISTIEIEH
ncbi:unnamed protein product [Heligmosomoides polygyrus]|uniref:MARVEL domain-containing protein n=1 Tax=Heligmosomoides polygyrus TaxID=6339 RepID=A0A183GHC2_HELPZ|nr:unnamed protein product [Heligmosomoides polygyrus]